MCGRYKDATAKNKWILREETTKGDGQELDTALELLQEDSHNRNQEINPNSINTSVHF